MLLNLLRSRALWVMLVGSVLIAIGLMRPVTPSVAQEVDEDVLTRGEYIVRVAGACVHCHGEGGDRAIDGGADPYEVALIGGDQQVVGDIGREFQYGVVYAPNLTTLGDWTDEEIENSIRYGVRPDGTVLMPPMAYEAYERMSDDDMTAVIAYLRSLEPVENEIPPIELNEDITREDVRTVPEIEDIERPALSEDATPAEQGEYLGVAIAACIYCHGSLTEDGLLDVDGPLAGETLMYTQFGVVPGPILLQRRVERWSDDQIIGVLNGRNPQGQPIFIMPSSVYTNMTDEDKAALVAWIRTQP